jgi:hypothetical protein
MRNSIVVFLFAVNATLSGIQGVAGVIPPIGLAPGSQYQVIFVTFDTTTATSSDINDYNAFVTAEAAFGAANWGLPNATWHAVASTPTSNAIDNAPSVGLPVYNTQGQLVAASSIYTGSLLTPVSYDEGGFPYGVANAAVWTGTDPFGVALPRFTLGGPGTTAAHGYAGGAGAFWLDQGSNGGIFAYAALYALSDPITVPIPEPATLTLLGSALLLLGGFRFLRARRCC